MVRRGVKPLKRASVAGCVESTAFGKIAESPALPSMLHDPPRRGPGTAGLDSEGCMRPAKQHLADPQRLLHLAKVGQPEAQEGDLQIVRGVVVA